MNYKFEELASQYYEKWKKHAIAKANYEMLDESKKSVLATEASKYDGSEAYRERMARKSKEYWEFLKWWQKALQLELELRHELNAIKMQFEYYRSDESTRRAEMTLH